MQAAAPRHGVFAGPSDWTATRRHQPGVSGSGQHEGRRAANCPTSGRCDIFTRRPPRQDRGPPDLREVCACPMAAPALEATCSCVCTEQGPCELELTLFSFRQLNHRMSSKPRTGVQRSSDFCSARTQAALKPHAAERRPARASADQDTRPWARGGFCRVQACHPGRSLSLGLPVACRGPPAQSLSSTLTP